MDTVLKRPKIRSNCLIQIHLYFPKAKIKSNKNILYWIEKIKINRKRCEERQLIGGLLLELVNCKLIWITWRTLINVFLILKCPKRIRKKENRPYNDDTKAISIIILTTLVFLVLKTNTTLIINTCLKQYYKYFKDFSIK